MNSVEQLEQWYARQCNGDWEHEFGIEISTLDNPGWSIRIDLRGTELETRPFQPAAWERSEKDWGRCRVVDGRFEGFGGPHQLSALLDQFLAWASA